MRKLIQYLSIFLFLLSCGRGSKDPNQMAYADDNILLYEEGDTVRKDNLPHSIANWMLYYQDIDTLFTLGNFIATGVHLHISDLPTAISKGNERDFSSVFEFAPSRKRYIDLFSYNHFKENGKIVAGEVDQQVVLGNYTDSSQKQLMYYGPAQSAEAVGWLNDSSFLLAIIHRSEDDNIQAELMLFNLQDSLYTNFQLDHTISKELLSKKQVKFLDNYLKRN